MTPLLSDWSDLGARNNLYENKYKDANENVVQGDVELVKHQILYLLIQVYNIRSREYPYCKYQDAIDTSLDKSNDLVQLVNKR